MSIAAAPQGATKKRFNAGGLVVLVIGLGIAGVIGVRVKEKVAQKKALEASMQVAPSPSTTPDEAPKGATKSGAKLARPEPLTWQPTIHVTGTLEPIQQADIGFKMGGKLLAIKAKIGDVVKTGQLLASVDAAEASAQANIAQTGVRVAEISLDMAKDGQKRTDSLYEKSAVPEAEKTSATQRALLAAAQLEQARAQARLASVTIGNAALSAPFSGLVTRAPSGIGKIVGPGEPLFHLEDTSVLKLSASVSESDAKIFEVGAFVTIEGSGATGKVTAVLGSLDPQTRRVPVIAEMPNGPEAGLLSGSFVRAKIVAKDSIDVLKLPGSALRPGSQDEVVVLKDGKAHLVRVAFSAAPDGSLYVRKGIGRADEIVANPSQEVTEGQTIELEEAGR